MTMKSIKEALFSWFLLWAAVAPPCRDLRSSCGCAAGVCLQVGRPEHVPSPLIPCWTVAPREYQLSTPELPFL